MRIYTKLPEGAEQLRQEVRDTGLKLITEHVEKEEWEKAQEISEGLINEDPKNANWYIWAGRIKAGMKKYKEAAENYEKVFELTGEKQEEGMEWVKETAYRGMVEAYIERGETDKAEGLAIELLGKGEEKAEDLIKSINDGYKKGKELRKIYKFGMRIYKKLPEGAEQLRQEVRDTGLKLIAEHVEKEEWGKAYEICEGLINEDPKNVNWYIWAGRVKAGMKKYKEAAENYEKVLELVGGAKDDESVMLKKAAYNGMIEAYLGTGEIEKADKVLSEQLLWLESVPECKEAGEEVLELWRRGRIKAGMKKYKEAAENYGKVLELIGEKQEEGMEWVKETAYRGITEAYIDGGETDKAEELAIELLGKGEEKAEDLIKSINDGYKKGKELRKIYKFGMRIYKKLPEGAEQLRQEVRDTGLKLITEHVEKEEWEKAQEISEGLINEDPKNVNWYIWAGRIKASQKNYKEAENYFTKGIELIGEQNNGELGWLKKIAYAGLINIFNEIGEIAKAKNITEKQQINTTSIEDIEGDMQIAVFESKLLVCQGDPKTLGMLTALYYLKREYDKAERSIEKALMIAPNDIWLNRWQGDVLSAVNKPGAVEAYQRAIDLSVNKQDAKFEVGSAYFGLANYYFRHGDKEKARKNAIKAHELDNNNTNIVEFLKLSEQ